MTFKHSGDLGDIIWSLPAIKQLGGGVLYLDPDGGAGDGFVNIGAVYGSSQVGRDGKDRRTRLTEETIRAIEPVLREQHYIEDVKVWTGEKVDANLNAFRAALSRLNLMQANCSAMNVPPLAPNDPWLECLDPIELDRPVIMARSLRLHCNDEFWGGMTTMSQESAYFVGLEIEYQAFCQSFPHLDIPHYPTETIHDLFRVIAGADRVIANETLANVFAEGLKKEKILEVYRDSRRCVIERPGAAYV